MRSVGTLTGLRDLNNFHLFAEIAERGSYSAAENSLGIPKSRLSRRVTELEAELGVKLIQRSTRRFCLTEAGVIFLKHCQAIAKEAEAGCAAVSLLQESPRGTVRVSCLVNASRLLLAPILPGFIARYPDVNIAVTLTNRFVDLYEEGIDVAIRIGPHLEEAGGIIVKTIGHIPQHLVASPELIRRVGPCEKPDDIRSFPTLDISATRGRHTWLLSSPSGEHVEFLHHPRLISDDIESLRRAAIDGAGIVRLSRMMLGDDVDSGRLKIVVPNWSLSSHTLYLAFLSRVGLAPSVRAFVDYVTEAFQKIQGVASRPDTAFR